MAEKMKTIAVRKDNCGNVLEVLEIKTILETRFKELHNQAIENSAKCEQEKAFKEKVEKDARDNLFGKVSKHDLFVAKSLFNDLVDKGLMETNDDFENMFFNYIKGVSGYNVELEPQDFKKIMEGVKR